MAWTDPWPTTTIDFARRRTRRSCMWLLIVAFPGTSLCVTFVQVGVYPSSSMICVCSFGDGVDGPLAHNNNRLCSSAHSSFVYVAAHRRLSGYLTVCDVCSGRSLSQ